MSPSERKPTDLSLFGIESTIVELLALRDDIEADPDASPAEIAESLKATDEAIAAWLARELTKVDGVAHVLREFEARAEVAKRERDRLNERAKRWQRQHDLLEERIKEALQFRLQATGRKTLEGETSTLSLAKCPPSVDVRQPGLVPTQYLRVNLTMPLRIWEAICRKANAADPELFHGLAVLVEENPAEPIKAEILKELKLSDPCERCDGTGIVTVPLELRIPNDKPCEQCAKCHGTGKIPRGVAGCVLVTDKVKLVLK